MTDDRFVGDIPLVPFFLPGDSGACGFYRMMQPGRALARKHKLAVKVAQETDDAYTILIAQRSMGVEMIEQLHHIKRVRKEATGVEVPKIIYELDDDLWSIERDNPVYDKIRANGNLERAIEGITLADAVIVSTENLAGVVRKWNDNVYVMPNSISKKYMNETAFPYEIDKEKPFVIGWQGSYTHENDFKMCVPGLNAFLKGNPNSRMVFYGNDYSRMLDSSVRSQCRMSPWTKTVPEHMQRVAMSKLDVMLAPLHPTTFNMSKSNLRLLEAQALGIPVIATEFGPYSNDRSPGTVYVKPGASWLAALEETMNPLRRLELSAAGRQWVRDGYTQEDTVDLWLDCFREVLTNDSQGK